MLNFQIATERDRREAATLQRRRAQEEERKKRIFNPRQRLIGIDIDALNKQIEEKKIREAEEREIQRKFESEQRRNDVVCIAFDAKEKEERIKINKGINEFRRTYQKPEDRREYDLNDPNYLKKQLPARYRDDDPRCGISSAQKFDGEDLMSDERAKIQKEQINAYLSQQLEEKQSAEKERKDAEDAYLAAMKVRDERAMELERLEKECRKRLELACLRYNKALADEKEMTKQRAKLEELNDNTAEIYNMMTSDMLTENPDVSQSSLGLNRRIGYMYKGMSAEEKQQIHAYLKWQIDEKKKRKSLEDRAEKEYQDYVNGLQTTVAFMDKEQSKRDRERLKQLAEENRQMGIEHKNHKEYMDKIVYSNKPTAAYYDQFNKSTR